VLLDHDRYCDEIVSQAVQLADLVDDTDPATPVPTCPEWTIGDVLDHVTGNLRVLHEAVGVAEARTALRRTGRSVVRSRPDEVGPTRTSGGHGRPAASAGPRGLTTTAADAAAALRHAGPRLRTRVCGLDGTTRAWARRAAHDLLIHRADIALTLGRPFDVAPDTGTDALEEILELLGGPPVPRPADRPQIVLHATDTGRTWSITPDGEAFTWRHELSSGTTPATLVGPLTALLLVTYRRLAPTSLSPYSPTRDDADLLEWIASLELA
jgi:uncharacterized protein (TIGR03083 family)